jgi:hypothetical protein
MSAPRRRLAAPALLRRAATRDVLDELAAIALL